MIVTINENDCGCATCGNIGNSDICAECSWDSKWEPKPVTNADRIKAMSDEELAKIMSVGCCGGKNGYCIKNEYGEANCIDCWIRWLKQPIEKEET